ncbi:MAG: serpin family protein [Phycisphaerae bacterium]
MKRILSLLLLGALMTPASALTPEERPQILVIGGSANNQFAASLHGQVSAQSAGNLIYSPASISTALAMTSLGAKGETLAQMQTVLGLAKFDGWHSAYGALATYMGEQRKDFELVGANRLWGQKGFAFLPTFLDESKRRFHAGLEEMDFVSDSEGARKAINAWVEKQTKDKIKDLLKPRVVDGETRLVLTNAVYFKAAWADQFTKSATKVEPFRLGADDRRADVATMHRRGSYRYTELDDVQVLEMPYKGREVSMFVLLPRKVDGIAALDKRLADPKWFESAVASIQPAPKYVNVALPKFKVTAEFELSDVLGKMGMPLAFDRARADFSAMTTQERLCISKVIHQAYVDVNEEGTEAAAATAVVMTRMSAMVPPNPIDFKADHPFAFVIRDQKSGAILFAGRVADPR